MVDRVIEGQLGPAPDALVMVADACTLERSLLLIAQVLRRGRPACLVLTMTDELHARGGVLDVPRLERALGIPVCGVVGHRGLGLAALRALLARPEAWSRPARAAAGIRRGARRLGRVGARERAHAASGPEPRERGDRSRRAAPARGRAALRARDGRVLPADLRLGGAGDGRDRRRHRLGRAAACTRRCRPASSTDFVADALIAGVGSVIVFLPQIVLLFTLLFLLEDIGYMARAAFVIDRVMGRIGLEGRSFVSLLSSYACAVPGIMATRTIPSPRNRLITILVAPLMTCSARLPVYALLIGAFVPATTVFGPLRLQGLVLLGLYLLGALLGARRGGAARHAR